MTQIYLVEGLIPLRVHQKTGTDLHYLTCPVCGGDEITLHLEMTEDQHPQHVASVICDVCEKFRALPTEPVEFKFPLHAPPF